MTALEMLADVAIPLMILNLGIQLRLLKVSKLRHAVAGVLIRMLGGLALAYAFVAIFGIGGVSRNVIFLDAIMPPAVFNVIFAQKYNADADVVASTIVLGTLFSVALTPAYLAFVT
jgi:predicted permease